METGCSRPPGRALGESAKPVTVAEAQGLQISLCYPGKVQAHKEVSKDEKTKNKNLPSPTLKQMNYSYNISNCS